MAEPEVQDLQQSNTTPGAMLRRQRQRMGWTVDEIANALCLSPKLIRSLEENEFAEMGGSTFVLGYLRGYARLIGVDIEDSILKHRDTIPEYEPDAENIPTVSNRKKKPARKRSKLDIGLLIGGVMIVGIGVGIYAYKDELVGVLQSGDVRTDTQRLTSRASGQINDAPSLAVNQSSGAADELSRAMAEELVQKIRTGESLPLILNFSDLGIVPVQVTADTSNESRDHLVLIFDEGSWADVRDARGDRLLSQTVAKGSSVDLTGQPPFTVFLGNASGVRVKYNGRIESYSQTKKGLFARFVVGQTDSSNQ